MAACTHETAIESYSELSRLIRVGAYDERGPDGAYGADGIEQAADTLEQQAAQHGLEFAWSDERGIWSLEPLSEEHKAAFLHVNVEKLVAVLAETAHYLMSLPYESELEKSARIGLHQRIEEVMRDSYRVPVLVEESEEEPPDIVVEQMRRLESPGYNQLGEDEPYYHEPDTESEDEHGKTEARTKHLGGTGTAPRLA